MFDSTLPAQPGLRVLLLAIVFLMMVRGYSLLGRLVLRRLGASERGRRLAPAICGAGLGVWAVLVWAAFA